MSITPFLENTPAPAEGSYFPAEMFFVNPYRDVFLTKPYRPPREELDPRPLPTPNCFHGQGFGMWIDYYMDRGYNHPLAPRTYTDAKRQMLQLWKDIGIHYFLSGQIPPLGQESDKIFVDEMNLLASYSTWPKGLNPPTMIGTLPHQRTMQSEDERYVLTLSDIEFLRKYSQYLSGVFLDEPDGRSPDSINDIITYIKELLKEGTNVSVITYGITFIETLCNDPELLDAIKSGRLILMSEQYYDIPEIDRSEFWRNLHSLLRKKDIHPSLVRPALSPQCDFCASNLSDEDFLIHSKYTKICRPEQFVRDIVKFMSYGFGGPMLYTGNGIPQEFYEYMILASWLAGCIELDDPGDENHLRPRTYIEFENLLKNKPLIKDILQRLKVYRDNPKVIDNPLSCYRCCFESDGSLRKTMGRCTMDLPCCTEPGGIRYCDTMPERYGEKL